MDTNKLQNAVGNGTVVSLKSLIEKSAQEIGKALPKHLNPERVIRIALTCIRSNPELEKCTQASFLGSLFVLAQLGLEPINGRAYLLPFNNKRKINGEWKVIKEVQALIGYRGLSDLFYRHEKSSVLNWGTVKEKDEFEYEYGTDPFLRHREGKLDRGQAIGYYVIAQLQNGGKTFKYMSKDECIAHGQKHSKTYVKEEYDHKQKKKIAIANPHFSQYSPWATDPDSMCLKTVLIQLAKLLPLSVELQNAISVDETTREYRTGIGNMIDTKDNTDRTAPETKKEIEEVKAGVDEKTGEEIEL